MALALLCVLFLLASCLGFGASILRALRLSPQLPAGEKSAWTWAVGYAFLGVILFPLALLGWLQPVHMVFLLAAGLPGLILLKEWRLPSSLAWLDWSLLLLLLAVLVLLAAHALAPPTDADSLAYHFARPKQILAEGRLTFIPRAVDGAAPLLVQLTYLPALALGGEKTMTLWATVSAVFPLLAVALVARRWLDRRWSLLLALLLLTTPAMLYGIGSGQVETRIVPFVFFAGLCLHQAWVSRDLRWLLLAGLLAGSFAAAKYFGLFFIAGCGLLCLAQRRWLAGGLLFSLGALITGGPIYLWNWSVTGDPLFPALFQTLGLADSPYWTQDQAKYFAEEYLGAEKPAPTTLGWFLLYPFKATLNGLPGWESLRTGFGPLGLLLLPFALLALPARALTLARHPLTWMLLAAFLFYALWFFLGASQRVRHLAPIYPILLAALMVASAKCARFKKSVLAACLLTLVMQLGGLLLYAKPALAYQAGDGTREDFVQRYVPNSSPVPWLNQHLGPKDRLLYFERQLTYYLDIPYFYAAGGYQVQLSLRFGERDDQALRWTQAMRLGITHMLLIPGLEEDRTALPQNRMALAFESAGCARRVASLPVTYFLSRTLPGLGKSEGLADIFELTPQSCDPARLQLANSGPNSYNQPAKP
ncbi:MAG: glycosyltransferase family 39 protein [Rhodospirillales bacterium]|nr:glycosyltransferase family 39 protein [Rhodospirillales bacterium]